MRYYLDSEFIDSGVNDRGADIELISIGIVAEDGRELYLQSTESDYRKASPWVKENVLTHLLMCPSAEPFKKWEIDGLYRADKAYHRKYGQCVDQTRGYIHNCPWRTREQIRDEVVSFLDPENYGKPELWGWCASCDFVVLYQLFGTMMDLPAGYPHYIRDIQYILDERGLSDDMLPPQSDQVHNALDDARYIKQLWHFLRGENAIE